MENAIKIVAKSFFDFMEENGYESFEEFKLVQRMNTCDLMEEVDTILYETEDAFFDWDDKTVKARDYHCNGMKFSDFMKRVKAEIKSMMKAAEEAHATEETVETVETAEEATAEEAVVEEADSEDGLKIAIAARDEDPLLDLCVLVYNNNLCVLKGFYSFLWREFPPLYCLEYRYDDTIKDLARTHGSGQWLLFATSDLLSLAESAVKFLADTFDFSDITASPAWEIAKREYTDETEDEVAEEIADATIDIGWIPSDIGEFTILAETTLK